MYTTTTPIPRAILSGRPRGHARRAATTAFAHGAAGRRPSASYEWISPGQAAVRLGVRVRDVYRLIDAGVLPAYRIDHQIRLLTHEVDEIRRRRG